MKKLLIFNITLYFLLCGLGNGPNLLKSQDYKPLAVEGAQWIVRYDDIGTPQTVDELWEYYSSGDTTIDNFIYKKVYKRILLATDEPPPFEPTGSYELFALVRDDTLNKEVYAILFNDNLFCPENEEILLYDLSVEVGDTAMFCLIPEGINFVIESIAQGTYFGFETKAYTSEGGNNYYEGLGSDFGLFEPIFRPVKSGKMGFTDQTYLYYYCREAPCQLVVSTQERLDNKSYSFEIYPNPSTNHLNMVIENPVMKGQIVLMNQQGAVLKIATLHDQKTIYQFNLNDLPAGLYFAGVLSAGNIISTRKVSVHK